MLSETVTIIRLINWPQAEGIITCYTRFGVALEFFYFIQLSLPVMSLHLWQTQHQCWKAHEHQFQNVLPIHMTEWLQCSHSVHICSLYILLYIYIYIMLYRLYVTECHGRVSAPRMTWHFACALVYTTDRFQAQCKTKWFLVLKKRSQISVSVRIYSCDVLSVITGFNLSGPLNL